MFSVIADSKSNRTYQPSTDCGWLSAAYRLVFTITQFPCSFYYQTLVISYVTLSFRNTVKVPEDRPRTSTARFHTKVNPRTGQEGPEGEQLYSSTVPSTSAIDWDGWWTTRSGRLAPGKDPVPIVLETGWGPEPHRDSIHGPSRP